MAKAKSKKSQGSSYPAKKTSKPNSQPKKQGAPQAKKPVAKHRGGVLTTVLVLILLHGILAPFLAYTEVKPAYESSKNWILAGLTLASVATIVSAVAMWYWKKWGIYLYTAASIIQMVVHMVLTGSLMVAFYDLLPVAILAYVINLQLKRELFE
jgi:hypothetical protein